MEHIRKHQTLTIGPPAQKRIGVLPYCAFKSCETASGPSSLANPRDSLPLFLTVRNTVPQFIMLIQLSPGNAGSPRSVVDEAERISSHLKRIVPQVALVQRHETLGWTQFRTRRRNRFRPAMRPVGQDRSPPRLRWRTSIGLRRRDDPPEESARPRHSRRSHFAMCTATVQEPLNVLADA